MDKKGLYETTCKSLKCPPDKPYITRGDHIVKGLIFRVTREGNKNFVARLFRDGNETQRGIGSYPLVTLEQAREIKRKFDKLWAEGIDPRIHEKKSKFQSIQDNAQSFEQIQELCFASKIATLSITHQKRWKGLYKNYLKKPIGILPLKDIDDSVVLEIVENAYINTPQTAVKVKNLVSVVFNYAIEKKWFKGINPCLLLRGNSLIKKPKNTPRKYLEEHRVGEFLHKLDSFQNQITSTFLYVIMMTALRTNSLRQARWSWLDDNGILFVPSDFMKAREKYRCPIPKQAFQRLQDLKTLLKPKQNDHIFIGLKEGKPISENTARLVYQEIMESKYHVHGFRTLLNRVVTASNKWSVEQIESQLTHAFFRNQERKTYMGEVDFLKERIEITQYFNDWCDNQRDLYKEANGIV